MILNGWNESIVAIGGSDRDSIIVHDSATTAIIGEVASFIIDNNGQSNAPMNQIVRIDPIIDHNNDIIINAGDVIYVDSMHLAQTASISPSVIILGGSGSDIITTVDAAFVSICGDYCSCEFFSPLQSCLLAF
jgi:hypothetical protein